MKLFIKIIFLLFFSLIIGFNSVSSYSFKDDSGIKNLAKPAGYSVEETNERSLELIIARNITFILSLVGVIFIILIIYAGINWMSASGNEEKVTKAKKIITDSIIGLVVVIIAYAVTYFILEFILESTWDQSASDL